MDSTKKRDDKDSARKKDESTKKKAKSVKKASTKDSVKKNENVGTKKIETSDIVTTNPIVTMKMQVPKPLEVDFNAEMKPADVEKPGDGMLMQAKKKTKKAANAERASKSPGKKLTDIQAKKKPIGTKKLNMEAVPSLPTKVVKKDASPVRIKDNLKNLAGPILQKTSALKSLKKSKKKQPKAESATPAAESKETDPETIVKQIINKVLGGLDGFFLSASRDKVETVSPDFKGAIFPNITEFERMNARYIPKCSYAVFPDPNADKNNPEKVEVSTQTSREQIRPRIRATEKKSVYAVGDNFANGIKSGDGGFLGARFDLDTCKASANRQFRKPRVMDLNAIPFGEPMRHQSLCSVKENLQLEVLDASREWIFKESRSKQQNSLIAGLRATNEFNVQPDLQEDRIKENNVERETEAEPKEAENLSRIRLKSKPNTAIPRSDSVGSATGRKFLAPTLSDPTRTDKEKTKNHKRNRTTFEGSDVQKLQHKDTNNKLHMPKLSVTLEVKDWWSDQLTLNSDSSDEECF